MAERSQFFPVNLLEPIPQSCIDTKVKPSVFLLCQNASADFQILHLFCEIPDILFSSAFLIPLFLIQNILIIGVL